MAWYLSGYHTGYYQVRDLAKVLTGKKGKEREAGMLWPSSYHVGTGRPPSISVAIVDWNLSIDILFFIEENSDEHYGGYSLVQNADFNINCFNKSLKKLMFTESWVIFKFF